ncbi:hypothetical protein Hanom_Chr12g01176061 [Helianthus anomalus]
MHDVVLITGSPCRCPGQVRISFGGLVDNDFRLAEGLKRGMEELAIDGNNLTLISSVVVQY